MKPKHLSLHRLLWLCLLAFICSGALAQDAQQPARRKKGKARRAQAAGKRIQPLHHYPCNLFEPSKPVQLGVRINCEQNASARVDWQAVDYYGKTVAQGQQTAVAKGRSLELPVVVNGLAPGWYELRMKTSTSLNGSAARSEEVVTSFGVAPLFSRTREESLKLGLRFGMRHQATDLEGLDGTLALGMPWERNLYINPGEVAQSPDKSAWKWDEALNDFKVHALDRQVLLIDKVEMFPRHCYDAKRYGPAKDYKDPAGKHPYTKRTVPEKESYQEWVRELTKRMPASQKLFEVWNEPWGKYPPEDFAQILTWTAEAIKQIRPDAIIGPDSGNIGYDISLAKLGAFKDCDMVTIHPYVPHPERSGVRNKIRLYHQFMKEHLGRDLPLYTTEWGFHATNKQKQAAYLTRQALEMYAEDIKALIPFICTPTRQEAAIGDFNYYGYVSYNYEPFPALLAYAACAQLIDGSRFVGDLWLGEWIGAMLFERNGIYTMALWTDEKPRQVTVDPGVASLKQYNMMGTEQTVQTGGKPLELTVTDEPLYLVGVSPEWAQKAVIMADMKKVWPFEEKEVIRHMPMAPAPPAIDGSLGDLAWKNAQPWPMNSKGVDEKDISAVARMLWDKQNLYLGLDVTDDGLNNEEEGVAVYKADSIELYLSTKPDMRIVETRGANDYQLIISPTSSTGKPVNYFPGDGSTVKARLKGETMAFKKREGGWIAEIAIPWSNFPGFEAQKGAKTAMEILINDYDRSNPIGRRDKIKFVDSLGTKYHRDAGPWGLLYLD